VSISERETVFFSGYAKLPSGITATEMYRIIGIMIVVDMETETITEADCTLITETGRNFVKKIIEGFCLAKGIEPLLDMIDLRYQGNAKRAIISALKIIYDKYKSYKEGHIISAFD
jgi:hypothetical protein